MKLLELLVKERIEWYPEAKTYTQDSNNTVFGYNCSEPVFKKSIWTSKSNKDLIVGSEHKGCPLADDWQTAIVTKEQYDNACKLVDDGYTLWFGGECPVNAHEVVEVQCNFTRTAGRAHFYDWKSENIKGYKVLRNAFSTEDVLKTKPDGSDEELSVVYERDVVNHPSHYTNGKVECIDAIESATVGKTGIEAVCVANVIKYLWRYEDKNGLEDIKKAQWYLNKLIEVKK